MSKLVINREHSLEHDALIAEVEKLADKLVNKYGGRYDWEGDELSYTYDGGITACVECQPDSVNVEVKFGMLMSMLKGPVKKEIEDYLDRHLA